MTNTVPESAGVSGRQRIASTRTARPGSPGGGEELAVGAVLVALAVSAWYFLGPVLAKFWSTFWSTWGTVMLLVAVVAVAATVAVGVPLVRRRRALRRLEAAVRAVVGRPEHDRRMIRARWQRGCLVRVVVACPAGTRLDAKAHRLIRDAVHARGGGALDGGVVDQARDRLTFTALPADPEQRRRAQLVERMNLAAESLVGQPDRGRRLVEVTDWSDQGGEPRHIVVAYPADWHPDNRARQELRTRIAAKTGIELDHGDWQPDLDRITYRTGAVAVVEARRRATVTRLDVAIRGLVGAPETERRLLTVDAWHDVHPERLTVHYPAAWFADSRGRQQLRDLISDKTGIDLDGGDWQPAIDRVTFTKAVPTEALEVVPEAETRIDELIRQTMRTTQTVTVTRWIDDAPAGVTVTFGPDARLSFDRYQRVPTEVLAANLPGRWRAKWDIQHGQVTFQRRNGLPAKIPHPGTLPDFNDKILLPFGVDEDGNTISWHLGGATPHALIIGPTGGGKTTLIRCLAITAAAAGVEVICCDPKRIELNGIRGYPGVTHVATRLDDMVRVFNRVYTEMNNRTEAIENGKVTIGELRPILFIIDEYLFLADCLADEWKKTPGKKGEHPALGQMRRLGVLARGVKIHLCVGMQRPDAAFLGGALRDQFQFRVSLSKLSRQGAEMLWLNSVTGTDLPVDIQGRCIAHTATGPTETQCWKVPDPNPRSLDQLPADDQDLLARLRPNPDILPPAVFADLVPTGPKPDPEPESAAPLRTRHDIVIDEDGRAFDLVAADQIVPGDQVLIRTDSGDENLVTVTDAAYEDDDYYLLTHPCGAESLCIDEPVHRLVPVEASADT
jgi:hypothetical protein